MLKTNSSELLTDAAIEDAAQWFVRMSSQPVSAEVQQSFQAWLEQSPMHELAYQQTAQLWTDLKAPAREAAKSGWHRKRQRRPFARKQFAKWSSIAAAAVIVITSTALWRDTGLIQRAFAEYAVAPGTYSELTLSDGSRVYLDGDSAINTNFSDAERNVELIRGRAWFDVTRSENRPFNVSGGTASVHVLGTAFAVELEPDVTKVTVERGLVAVHFKDRTDTVRLEAGDSATVTTGRIEQIRDGNAEARLAWRRGLIMMNQTPLKAVLQELGKYTAGRIILSDKELETLPVSGVFQAQDPDAVFDALRSTLNLTVVRVPGLMTIIYQ